MLFHIVAMARNRVIGKDNKLPWHFSSDMKHFKQRTMGSTVIMGRKTYESIGKPLPGRENFVLSRKPQSIPGVRTFTSIEEALKNIKTENAFIIGGAELYKETIGWVDGIYLTRIDADYEGDVFYPEVPDSFDETEIEELQENPKIEVVLYQKKEKHTEEGSAG